MVQIKTKQFILRHVKQSDAQALFEIERDKDYIKNMMHSLETLEEVKEDIKNNIKQYKLKKPSSEKFIIEINKQVAGYISINNLNKLYFEHKAVISYALHPNFRGKGFLHKAVKKITSYAFKKYKLKRISARCRSFNKASARVLEKAGFTLEGVHKKEFFKNGRYLTNLHFAIVK